LKTLLKNIILKNLRKKYHKLNSLILMEFL
jgi:hypothetical protein